METFLHKRYFGSTDYSDETPKDFASFEKRQKRQIQLEKDK